MKAVWVEDKIWEKLMLIKIKKKKRLGDIIEEALENVR